MNGLFKFIHVLKLFTGAFIVSDQNSIAQGSPYIYIKEFKTRFKEPKINFIYSEGKSNIANNFIKKSYEMETS
jgi:hypothetical protein